MRKFKAALVLAPICLSWSALGSAQSSDSSFYICQKLTPHPNSILYISEVFEAPKDARQDQRIKFLGHIVAHHGVENEPNGPYGVGCRMSPNKSDAELERSAMIERSRHYPLVEAKWPTGRKTGRTVVAPVKKQGPGSLTIESVDAKPSPARPDYVEVAGPNGKMRLSPEVAARNKAAADEYARKMQEHSEAVARAKANEQENAAQYAASQARHAESVAKAAAEKRDYDRRLADLATKDRAKEAAKPVGGKAIYRGFLGPDCGIARSSANRAGWFVEVENEISRSGNCTVIGWWTPGKSVPPRQ